MIGVDLEADLHILVVLYSSVIMVTHIRLSFLTRSSHLPSQSKVMSRPRAGKGSSIALPSFVLIIL